MASNSDWITIGLAFGLGLGGLVIAYSVKAYLDALAFNEAARVALEQAKIKALLAEKCAQEAQEKLAKAIADELAEKAAQDVTNNMVKECMRVTMETHKELKLELLKHSDEVIRGAHTLWEMFIHALETGKDIDPIRLLGNTHFNLPWELIKLILRDAHATAASNTIPDVIELSEHAAARATETAVSVLSESEIAHEAVTSTLQVVEEASNVLAEATASSPGIYMIARCITGVGLFILIKIILGG